MTVKKPKLKPLQNRIRDLCSVRVSDSSRGSFSSRLSASFCQNSGPAKVTLMPLSGHSFTFHKPLGNSKCPFFQL